MHACTNSILLLLVRLFGELKIVNSAVQQLSADKGPDFTKGELTEIGSMLTELKSSFQEFVI